MFWRYNTASTSQIESLLEKVDVGLVEVLEQEDIIQECKNQNKKLCEYLTSTEVLSELVSLIISEPPPDIDEAKRFRLPYVAAEILSCEVPQINEKLSSDVNLLSKLYSFIEQEPPLNPLLSSFFSKAFNVLVTRKSEQNWYSYQITCIQVFEFLKRKEFVSHVLQHIGTSAIPDLVFGLITCVEATDIKQNLLNWLNEKRLIQSFVGLLDSELYDRDTHDNASRFLVELLRVSRDGQYVASNERIDDPLLAVLEAPSTATFILAVMFKHIDAERSQFKSDEEEFYPSAKNESVIVNGVAVLLAILQTRKAVNGYESQQVGGGATAIASAGEAAGLDTSEEWEKQQALLDAAVSAMLPRLSDLTRLLTHPPLKPSLKTTAGTLASPLGATRLSIAKFVCGLLMTGNLQVIQRLEELKVVNILLDLFFTYSLNNFLHAQVEQCVNIIFEWTPGIGAASHIFFREEGQREEIDKPTNEDVKIACEGTADQADGGGVGPDSKETVVDQVEEKANGEREDEGKRDEMLSQSKGNEDEQDHLHNEDLEWETTARAEAEKVATSLINDTPYENTLLEHLYNECHFIQRILDAWQENEREQQVNSHLRKGYMGHLTRIANMVQHHLENKTCSHDLVTKLMNSLPESVVSEWSNLISGKLAETNERNRIVPASAYSGQSVLTSSEEDDSDYREIQFQSDTMQQMYSDYQMQQMSDNLVDPFPFKDGDDTSGGTMKRFMNFNFGLDEVIASSNSNSNDETSKSLFEMVCEQRFSGVDDDEEPTAEKKEGQVDSDDDDDDDESDKEAEDPWVSLISQMEFGRGAAQPQVSIHGDVQVPAECQKQDKMDVDVSQDGDPWTSLSNREVPSEVAPIDINAGGNPWDSANAVSSPTHSSSFEEAFSPNKAVVVQGEIPNGEVVECWANFSTFEKMKQDTEEEREEGGRPPATSTPSSTTTTEGGSPIKAASDRSEEKPM